MHLCLDLSTKCTGYSVFTKDGKLKRKGRIIPSDSINIYHKINYVTEKIKILFKGIDEIIIEGLYYNKHSGGNLDTVLCLARLSGAVINAWVTYSYKEPHIIKAIRARKLLNIHGFAHKAEIQIYVLSKYKFATTNEIKIYQKSIDSLKSLYKNSKITRGQYRYRMDKLSRQIDEDTGIGEDIADSIVVGLAYNVLENK